MSKVIVFNHITLDGYFTDAQNSMSWAHAAEPDEEWNAFVAENASGGGRLLMGRVTYDLMAGYWPTPMAAEGNPVIAERMNSLEKIVFTKTLETSSWKNTKLVKGDLLEEVRKLKSGPGDDIVILGSGSIVAQLAQAGLIDEFQLVVNPVALGAGRTLFAGIKEKLNLKLDRSRTFGNGIVFLTYKLQ